MHKNAYLKWFSKQLYKQNRRFVWFRICQSVLMPLVPRGPQRSTEWPVPSGSLSWDGLQHHWVHTYVAHGPSVMSDGSPCLRQDAPGWHAVPHHVGTVWAWQGPL